MTKKASARKQLDEYAASQWAEWHRLTDDSGRASAIRQFRKQHTDLPVASQAEEARWRGNEPYAPARVGQHAMFWDALRAFAAEQGIPAKFEGALYQLVVFGRVLSEQIGATGFHERRANLVARPGQEYVVQEQPSVWISTVDTLIDNAIVARARAIGQRREIMEFDPPPQPTRRGRAVDWGPVREWRKRHPGITLAEIGRAIGYAPQTVRVNLGDRIRKKQSTK